MGGRVKIGIIICDRYSDCAGGKCFRALRERQGAFAAYRGKEVELVGFSTCGGCPGGNLEYAPGEMKKSGAEVIHLATGFVVGYPPCPHLRHFVRLLPKKFGMKVVVGTHPIPQNYYSEHRKLKTWSDPGWGKLLRPTLADEKTRLAYD